MKLLLDVQLSYQIAEELTTRGHDCDAVTLREDIPDTTPDDELLAIAHREQRVLVTNNVKDFRKLAAQRIASGAGHSGLILIARSVPRTRAAVKHLAGAVEERVQQYSGGLTDTETWVSNA